MSFAEILQRYAQKMDAVVAPRASYWTFIGHINGESGEHDVKLVLYGNGFTNYLQTDEPIHLDENSEFYICRIDLAAGCKEVYGADGKNGSEPFRPNLVGYYYVKYNITTGEILFFQETETG